MEPDEKALLCRAGSRGNPGDSSPFLHRRRAGAAQRVLGATGLTLERLRESANEPDFLAGVLEHMLADESLLLAFADSAAIDPAGVTRARTALGGNWERDIP